MGTFSLDAYRCLKFPYLMLLICLLAIEFSLQGAAAIQIGSWRNGGLIPGSIYRGLKQQWIPPQNTAYGQFSPIADRSSSYGSWGGSWGNAGPTTTTTTITSSQPASSGSSSSAIGAVTTQSGGSQSVSGTAGVSSLGTATASGSAAAYGTVVKTSNVGTGLVVANTNNMGTGSFELVKTVNGVIPPGSSTGTGTTVMTSGNMVAGTVTQPSNFGAGNNAVGTGSTVMAGKGGSTYVGPSGNAMMSGNAAAGSVTVTGTTSVSASGAVPAATSGTAVATGTAGTSSGQSASSASGTTLSGVYRDMLDGTRTVRNGPYDPGSAGVVTTQATAFDMGYCVPRQSFVFTNVTAMACNPGSNLTKWDGQDVCARIDCEAKLNNDNIINAATFCRTVVQPPQYICPSGCEVITQRFFNTTTNVTRDITRCSCRAGNQPCPGTYVGCICQPAFITNLNATAPYVLCSAQQSACDQNCQVTANKFGPLCPIIPDASLPDDPLAGPVYPRWSWDLAAQGQATAAVAPGTPVGRRLLKSLNRWRGDEQGNHGSSGRSLLSGLSVQLHWWLSLIRNQWRQQQQQQ